jgi:ATP-dependent Clp protease adapter protein ClpS
MPTLEMAVKAPVKKRKSSTGTGAGFEAKTILFNDNVHTFDDVARQLMKAIRCTYAQGMGFANVVHNVGSAVVYTGHLERCEAVAMVLEEIKLRVIVER